MKHHFTRAAIAGSLLILVGGATTPMVHAQVPVSGLTLWADASSITGLNDGDPVALWTNLSPNLSLNLTQGAPDNRPTYKTGILNGLPVLRFDGINDYLFSSAMTNFVGSLSTEYTIFSVFNARLINTDATPIYNNDAIVSDASGFVGQHLKGLTANAFNWDGNADSIGTPVQTNAWYVLRSGLGSGSLFVHANNQPLQSTASGANTLNSTHQLRVGFRTAYFDGDIAELLIYNRALTLEERNQVAGYLADKYAITIPEPSALAVVGLGMLLLRLRRCHRH